LKPESFPSHSAQQLKAGGPIRKFRCAQGVDHDAQPKQPQPAQQIPILASSIRLTRDRLQVLKPWPGEGEERNKQNRFRLALGEPLGLGFQGESALATSPRIRIGELPRNKKLNLSSRLHDSYSPFRQRRNSRHA